MKDADDIVAYRKSIDRRRVYIFLTGLDNIFETSCGEILRKEQVLDLVECYALIGCEAVHHTILKGKIEDFDASTMIACKGYNHQERPKVNNASNVYNSKCSHYNKNGHTKNKCFDLVGYLEWWDHNQKNNNKKVILLRLLTQMVKLEQLMKSQH